MWPGECDILIMPFLCSLIRFQLRNCSLLLIFLHYQQPLLTQQPSKQRPPNLTLHNGRVQAPGPKGALPFPQKIPQGGRRVEQGKLEAEQGEGGHGGVGAQEEQFRAEAAAILWLHLRVFYALESGTKLKIIQMILLARTSAKR